MPIIFLLLAFIILVLWLANLYNNLLRLRTQRKDSFADIDVLLNQRNDLIPKLIETVKVYTANEKTVLQEIMETCSAAVSATTIDDKMKAEQQLLRALNGLRMDAQTDPDLKANQNFLELQEELDNIENELASVRYVFDEATNEYKNAVESFPANIIAVNFGFFRERIFDAGREAEENIRTVQRKVLSSSIRM